MSERGSSRGNILYREGFSFIYDRLFDDDFRRDGLVILVFVINIDLRLFIR